MNEQLETLLYSNDKTNVELAIQLMISQKIRIPDELIYLCNLLNICHWRDTDLFKFLTQPELQILHMPISTLPRVIFKLNYFNYNFFGCSLTTLTNCPKRVEGYLNVNENKLYTLHGAPEYVGQGFTCSHNYLQTLEFMPRYIGHRFWCHGNLRTFKQRDIDGRSVIIPEPNTHYTPIRFQ